MSSQVPPAKARFDLSAPSLAISFVGVPASGTEATRVHYMYILDEAAAHNTSGTLIPCTTGSDVRTAGYAAVQHELIELIYGRRALPFNSK